MSRLGAFETELGVRQCHAGGENVFSSACTSHLGLEMGVVEEDPGSMLSPPPIIRTLSTQ